MGRLNLALGTLLLTFGLVSGSASADTKDQTIGSKSGASQILDSSTSEQYSSLPQVLDSSTLAQYPDDPETIINILNSEKLKGKYVVVELVAGWCPHCAALKPEMDQAISNLTAEKAPVDRLTIVIQEDVPRDPKTGKRPSVYGNVFGNMTTTGGFPEVQIWKDGYKVRGFSGAPPSEYIEDFINETIAAIQSWEQQQKTGPKLAPGA